MQNAQGETVGYGHSTWALIDYDTRQPVNLENLPDGGFSGALHPEDVPIAGAARARVKSETPVLVHRAAFSDLDINGHVNSIRYITLLLEHLLQAVARHARGETHRDFLWTGSLCRRRTPRLCRCARHDRWAFEIRRVRPTEGDKETLVVRRHHSTALAHRRSQPKGKNTLERGTAFVVQTHHRPQLLCAVIGTSHHL